MASVMSLTQMVFITVPILAPSLGQLLLVGTHHWQVMFVALLLYGLLVLAWCALRLPETLPSEKRKSIAIRQVLGYYRRTITTRQTIGYAIAAGGIQGAMFSYLFSAQQVFAEFYHLGRYFTLAFSFSAIGFLTAGFFNSRFVGRFGMRVISHAALLGLITAAIIFLFAASYDSAPLWLFMVIAACTTFGSGLTFANFTALAMEPQGDIAGTASSLFGSITTLLAITIGTIVGQSYDGTIFPMAVGLFLSVTGAIMVVLVTEKGRLFKPHNKPVA
jgi:DHA1 family bicyclomycin/chloramphenicol resistance-like MFS transporter